MQIGDKMKIAKSGRKYRSIPDGYNIEQWDKMTVKERLIARKLLINENISYTS